ncbi:MAG: ATP-dependent zinc protease [Planctomycetes bacterium]|nr:ATP-dependent zinc protease [Planctomycetota bacterium]MBL7009450.1 ATP-dependent zinc protease [Planctomycetota bacterium]
MPSAVDDSPDGGPVVIGWREFIGLPEWGIPRIKAKADTGARTSALHVANLEELGGGRVRFDVVVHEAPRLELVTVEAVIRRIATVKPTPNKVERRPVVETTMSLGGRRRRIELALVCRRGMLCRMLLGRTALDGAFFVDPGSKYRITGRAARQRGVKELGS